MRDDQVNLRIVTIAVVLIAVGFAGPLSAEIYKWVDPAGNVHYGDQKPPDVEFRVIATPSPSPATPPPTAKPSDVPPPDSMDNCPVGKDSFQIGDNVFCCNSRCVRQRLEQGLEVNCLDPRCHAAVRQIQQAQTGTRGNAPAASTLDIQERKRAWMADFDRKTVEGCKRRREVYCDKSPAEIRRLDGLRSNW